LTICVEYTQCLLTYIYAMFTLNSPSLLRNC